ncbi:MAG: hypothetical protein ACR2MX_17660 [Cyclobacteriaceae bacterium]
MKLVKSVIVLLIICLISSCDYISKNKEPRNLTDSYFEGEITLTESRGLYGSLFNVHTTYILSENGLKREQKMGGLNRIANTYAGLIIDLEKDSVYLYYSDPFVKNKHSLSVADYQNRLAKGSIPQTTPSPIDNTFTYLSEYNASKTVEDSLVIEGFSSDYSHYSEKVIKQEVFDTKETKIKRELLEMTFINLPDTTNFPLRSEFRTTISDIKNDSIINSDEARLLDKLARSLVQKTDSSKVKEKTDLDKLSDNKLINWGLNILKKGVDLNIHISTEVSKITNRNIDLADLSFPSGDFQSITDFDEFFDAIPTGRGDFDD